LIYRRGGLGDTLLTFPLAEALKKSGFEVHFAGNYDYLLLGKEAGLVDRVFSDLPPRTEDYDRVFLLSFQNFTDRPDAVLINPFPPAREPVWRYYLREAGFEGFEPSKVLPLPSLPDWEGRVVLHPGSGSEKKNAPLELFKNLYRRLEGEELRPLFVLGEAERRLKEELKDFDLYEVKNLLDFARLLKGAAGFVGNDSGFTHLASYLGVPTVALFGPTDPLVWAPFGPLTAVLYEKLDCSPCFPKDCTGPVPKECLKRIGEKRVLATLKGLMEKRRKP